MIIIININIILTSLITFIIALHARRGLVQAWPNEKRGVSIICIYRGAHLRVYGGALKYACERRRDDIFE